MTLLNRKSNRQFHKYNVDLKINLKRLLEVMRKSIETDEEKNAANIHCLQQIDFKMRYSKVPFTYNFDLEDLNECSLKFAEFFFHF